jgi:hypothetical protein
MSFWLCNVEQRVLVGDLLHGKGRLVHVAKAGVRIAVREELRGVLLLQLDHPPVEDAGPLHRVFPPRVHLGRIADAVARLEMPVAQEVEIDVNALLFQLRDEVVVAVENLGIEGTGIASAVVDQSGPSAVGGVQPHQVDPKAGQSRGGGFGDVSGRRRTGTAHVGAEEPGPRAVGEDKVSLLVHGEKAVFPRRPVQEMAQVDLLQRRVVQRERPLVPVSGATR